MVNTFGKPIIPGNEAIRIKALNSYAILNGFPDKYFNKVARTIAKAFDTKIALISLVASEHVEFKGNFGMEDTDRADRGVSLCSLAILDNNPTVFEDATKEPCLLNNPLVAGDFGLRFYAGVPLTTREGLNIGTVCIVDKEPRTISSNEIQLLSRFANDVMNELEQRRILEAGHS
jgi:GAF domain-containing protein